MKSLHLYVNTCSHLLNQCPYGIMTSDIFLQLYEGLKQEKCGVKLDYRLDNNIVLKGRDQCVFFNLLRTVPTIVIAHTFCASRDTRISYQ